MTSRKPIRKDRVLIALLVLVGIILIPVLVRSCSSTSQSPTSTTPATVSPPITTVPPHTEEPPSEEPPSEEPPITEETPAETPPGILTHTVSDGETLTGIAALLGVTTSQIMADNRLLSAGEIVPGERLRIARDGILHLIKEGQTLTDISTTYGVSIDRITIANEITDPSSIFAGEDILIPGATTALWENVIRFSHGQRTRFIWPLEGEVVSEFGWRVHPVLGMRHHHDGIDIDVPTGTIVHAAAAGKVFFIGEQEGYGTTLILKHANEYYTLYGHLSQPLVHVGQFVETGQGIAESGNTGISTGPHLHFEIRNREFPIDPRSYLP
ncbi:MAG: M23 family metallopeptidase [Candidatus Bipolaricaulota bacterium]|nr:M23 family metallopeptidase [Candidatus Bipolaricaulota bacterium]